MDYKKYLQKAPEKLTKAVSFQFVGCKEHGRMCAAIGALTGLGDILTSLGGTKALIVTDHVLEQVGILGVVVDFIKQSNIEADVFMDISPEPHIADFRKVQAQMRQGRYDVVIGIGGGSSLDVAKVAAITGTNDGDVLEYCLGKKIEKPGVPCVLIPTTSGTGSEVSPYIVASHEEKKLFIGSPLLYPTVALVDPLLTVTMPPKVTASTGADALTHAIEGYIGKDNPITETFTNKAVEYIFRYLERACKNGEDLEARYYMSFAAMYGMLSYSQGGGLYAHSMSYILTLDKGIPHGIGCGVGLANTIVFNMDYIEQQISKLSTALQHGCGFKPSGEVVVKFAEQIQELLRAIQLPTSLRELGVEENQLRSYAREFHTNYYRLANPRKMSLDEAERLMCSMWRGQLEKF